MPSAVNAPPSSDLLGPAQIMTTIINVNRVFVIPETPEGIFPVPGDETVGLTAGTPVTVTPGARVVAATA